MYSFTLDFTERVLKTAQIESIKGHLEAKRTELKLNGKNNKTLDEMIGVLEDIGAYMYLLFEYAEKEAAYARKLEGENRELKMKVDSQKKELQFFNQD